MTKVLITFGCSWTFGVGVGYDESMSLADYKNINQSVEVNDQLSFRGIISQRHGFENINFSKGGSSNQKQVRLAKTFFNSKKFQDLQESGAEIVVLWGITSTSRNESFVALSDKVIDFMYSSPAVHSFRSLRKKTVESVNEDMIALFFAKNLYNHEHEIFMLAHELAHWNTFFKSLGIKNYWYDTFNHHDYTGNDPSLLGFETVYKQWSKTTWPIWQDFIDKRFPDVVGDEILDTSKFEFAQFVNTLEITNFVIDQPQDRDLMSQLVIRNGNDQFDRNYHLSHWAVDGNRVEYLANLKLLNPYSFHPTKLGHEQIANMFDHLFEKTS
jgi:hypothetical protein